MTIEHNSDSSLHFELSNGNKVIVLHNEKTDELSISFRSGHRNIKELQNRIDGYSGVTFTESENKIKA